MSTLTMLRKTPSTHDVCVYWKTVKNTDYGTVSYAKVRDRKVGNFYLQVNHRSDGLYDCAVRRPDLSKGHLNKGKVEVLFRCRTTLIEAKLWLRNWYLQKYNLSDVWIQNDGKSDITALASRCKYDGDLIIRDEFRKKNLTLIFSNLKTGRVCVLPQNTPATSVEDGMAMADRWYNSRRTGNDT